MFLEFLDGLEAGLITLALILGILIIPVVILGTIFLLALSDIFFTFVSEGQAKSVLKWGRFNHALLSYAGHGFRGNLAAERYRGVRPRGGINEINFWDIIEAAKKFPKGEEYEPSRFELFLGLRWIGLWPIYTIFKKRFSWNSYELKEVTEEGERKVRPVIVHTEQILDYDLVQPDVYALPLEETQTRAEYLPLVGIVVFQAQVVNPYKARFRIQHWLEASINMMTPEIRMWIAGLTFEEVLILKGITEKAKEDEEGEQGRARLDSILKNLLDWIFENWGVKIWDVKIIRIDPSTATARRALEAQANVFVAEQEAKAAEIQGEGLAKRAQIYYGRVSEIRGGSGMFAAEALENSKITVYAPGGEGRGLLPTFDVSGTAPPQTEGSKRRPSRQSRRRDN